MSNRPNTLVRLFGSLQTLRRKQGFPAVEKVYISPQGCTGVELARTLGLPLDKVEGVFINNLAFSLEARIRPGDKVAFIAHFPAGKGAVIT